MDPTLSVSAFYVGRSVFVTGASGFMGKVLIEKLLRSCPEIREIFLLIRPKKGVSIDERLAKILALPVSTVESRSESLKRRHRTRSRISVLYT